METNERTDGQTDGRTDEHDLANAVGNYSSVATRNVSQWDNDTAPDLLNVKIVFVVSTFEFFDQSP